MLREGDAVAFAKRITFVIDPEGTIRRVYEVDDVEGHPDEILADLSSLGAPAG